MLFDSIFNKAYNFLDIKRKVVIFISAFLVYEKTSTEMKRGDACPFPKSFSSYFSRTIV